MRNNVIASLAVVAATLAAPAQAEDWNAYITTCTAAAEAQGLVTAGEYNAKFLTASGGSVKRITLELAPDAGEPITAECKVKRGKVKELAIKV